MKDSTVANALLKANADARMYGAEPFDRCRALRFARDVLKRAQEEAQGWKFWLTFGLGAGIAVLDVAIRLACED